MTRITETIPDSDIFPQLGRHPAPALEDSGSELHGVTFCAPAHNPAANSERGVYLVTDGRFYAGWNDNEWTADSAMAARFSGIAAATRIFEDSGRLAYAVPIEAMETAPTYWRNAPAVPAPAPAARGIWTFIFSDGPDSDIFVQPCGPYGDSMADCAAAYKSARVWHAAAIVHAEFVAES